MALELDHRQGPLEVQCLPSSRHLPPSFCVAACMQSLLGTSMVMLTQSCQQYPALACRRNELVALDLILTAVATAFAFVSMIGGIYGEQQQPLTIFLAYRTLMLSLCSVAIEHTTVNPWLLQHKGMCLCRDEYTSAAVVSGVHGETEAICLGLSPSVHHITTWYSRRCTLSYRAVNREMH